ncbi:ACP S-malonyltransferase [Sporolactobacillus shoreicorticis]|uniref:[acyl-carrier-protein] S-malonyltransferase n=1 Tax=Sporolactobacillus shoreicorticis TaxID=1923877 RepID=A0ABW5S2Q8_9BACL|nr:ACP S-malonyltransferase [Sporolactobacillus shoreicorticis]MCO7124505.1 ACP S-malonyltransferase [Sporolactobacillus shoreicorticis]
MNSFIKNKQISSDQWLASNGIYKRTPHFIAKKLVVMFPGHGSQYHGMFKGFQNEAFQSVVRRADVLYKEKFGEKLSDYWESGELDDPLVMQTSIYTVNVAMYEAYKESGHKPNYLIGHSLGEISALAAGSSITFDTGFEICCIRASLLKKMDKRARGNMISIKTSPDDERILDFVWANEGSCSLSIINNSSQIVVSGRSECIGLLNQYCMENDLKCFILPIPFAFHSELLKEIYDPFKAQLDHLSFGKSVIPVYSTILNRFYRAEDYQQLPQLLAMQLLQPFSFYSCIEQLIHLYDANIFIELGAGTILTKLIKNDTKLNKDIIVLASNAKKADPNLTFKGCLAALNLNTSEGI